MPQEQDPKITRFPFETFEDLPQEVADFLQDTLVEDPSFSLTGAIEIEVERNESGEIVDVRRLPEPENLDK